MIDKAKRNKFLAIYKASLAGHPSAAVGQKSLSAEDEELFKQFIFDVGALFTEIREELDQGLEDLADDCPEETDPRKWNEHDWYQFTFAVKNHKFREIYTLMAQGKENIHLIWREIEARL